jgi:hypothetical protein
VNVRPKIFRGIDGITGGMAWQSDEVAALIKRRLEKFDATQLAGIRKA